MTNRFSIRQKKKRKLTSAAGACTHTISNGFPSTSHSKFISSLRSASTDFGGDLNTGGSGNDRFSQFISLLFEINARKCEN